MPVQDFGNPQIGLMATGTLGAQEDAVTIPDLRGAGSASVQITGTFNATVAFEVSNDGTNWVAVELTTPAGAAAATTATTAGIFVGPVGGYRKLRARCSVYASGSAAVTISTSPAGYAPLP
jgi:hypothetical protein